MFVSTTQVCNQQCSDERKIIINVQSGEAGVAAAFMSTTYGYLTIGVAVLVIIALVLLVVCCCKKVRTC